MRDVPTIVSRAYPQARGTPWDVATCSFLLSFYNTSLPSCHVRYHQLSDFGNGKQPKLPLFSTQLHIPPSSSIPAQSRYGRPVQAGSRSFTTSHGLAMHLYTYALLHTSLVACNPLQAHLEFLSEATGQTDSRDCPSRFKSHIPYSAKLLPPTH